MKTVSPSPVKKYEILNIQHGKYISNLKDKMFRINF